MTLSGVSQFRIPYSFACTRGILKKHSMNLWRNQEQKNNSKVFILDAEISILLNHLPIYCLKSN